MAKAATHFLWNLLSWTFAEKFLEDEREPLIVFFQQWKIELFIPSVSFMLQVIWIVFLQMILGCILATVIYVCILPNVKQSSTASKALSTTASLQGFLVGFGFVIPATMMLPYHAIDSFDIRNLGFRLAWCSLPMTIILRTVEAMFGFVPPQHCQTLWHYVRHTGFVLRPKYGKDGVTSVATTFYSIGRIALEYVFWISCMAVGYHFMGTSSFCPFTALQYGTTATEAFDAHTIIYWDWPRLYDTFFQACMMNFSLALSITGASALGSLLTGVQMDDDVTQHPMFLSESVSDFWGRRWNNLIHVALKQGVYKPVRAVTDSKSLASLAAFVVSGLCHEYVWALLYLPTTAQLQDHEFSEGLCCSSCYCESWMGKQLVFFGWNGVLIALEYLVAGDMASYTNWLPRLVRSHLIVLLSLPVGHLFTADITKAGYFSHLRSAIPMVTITRPKR
jgi:hypothetical protein